MSMVLRAWTQTTFNVGSRLGLSRPITYMVSAQASLGGTHKLR